ncbi:integral membrane HRF1 family protein [Actinidia rufa]|uniref:Integral membrane HRF1 family protein n=1 Tax=Actinidia rufa TaxID=165716 RepID=A0A7J0DNP6_9ERIC|nr:integral membrane HRF1 family protein [Actinidia rufa]
MYENSGSYARVLLATPNQQTNPFGDAIYGAGSDVIKSELGAYGERILGSGSAYVQGNGHWMRTTETVGGEFSYKPPIYDINAPDLYIPLMAFGTYLVLAGLFLGINGKFTPEALGLQFTNALLCWLLQVLLLETILHWLGGGELPVLDVVAYGGYTFVAASVIMLARVLWSLSFWVVTLWECLCMGVFLVKTMKRVLIAEVRLRSCDHNQHSSKRHYLLLLMAVAQFPLLFWLGNVGV